MKTCKQFKDQGIFKNRIHAISVLMHKLQVPYNLRFVCCVFFSRSCRNGWRLPIGSQCHCWFTVSCYRLHSHMFYVLHVLFIHLFNHVECMIVLYMSFWYVHMISTCFYRIFCSAAMSLILNSFIDPDRIRIRRASRNLLAKRVRLTTSPAKLSPSVGVIG